MSKTKRITRQNFDPSKIISIHSFSTTVSPPEHPPPPIPFSFMTVSLEYPEGRCSDRAVCAAGAHGEDGRSPAWLKSAQVVPWIWKRFPVLWVFPFLHSHQWNSLSWVRSNFGLHSKSSALAAYIGALNSFPHFKAKKKNNPLRVYFWREVFLLHERKTPLHQISTHSMLREKCCDKGREMFLVYNEFAKINHKGNSVAATN